MRYDDVPFRICTRTTVENLVFVWVSPNITIWIVYTQFSHALFVFPGRFLLKSLSAKRISHKGYSLYKVIRKTQCGNQVFLRGFSNPKSDRPDEFIGNSVVRVTLAFLWARVGIFCAERYVLSFIIVKSRRLALCMRAAGLIVLAQSISRLTLYTRRESGDSSDALQVLNPINISVSKLNKTSPQKNELSSVITQAMPHECPWKLSLEWSHH